MLTISNSEMFLLFASALIGLFGGIIGNWLVGSCLRVIDDVTSGFTDRQKVGVDIGLFGIGIIALGLFTEFVVNVLVTILQSS
jgi:hypothetical protein